MTRSYFRGAIGVIITYDITAAESFKRVEYWLNEVRQFARAEATYCILGNKSDLDANGERQVLMVEAAKFAQENECLFFEGSARSGHNIEECFAKLANTIHFKIDNGEIPEDIVSTNAKKASAAATEVSVTSLTNETASQSSYCSC